MQSRASRAVRGVFIGGMKKFLRYSWLVVLPMMAAAAVVWKASAAEPERQCPPPEKVLDHTVLIPNPADCRSYFSCSNGVAILLYCPDGLYFNAEIDACDWPRDSGCEPNVNRLKDVECTCPSSKGGKSGFSLRCRPDGNLEKCTSTQQGSNACYKAKISLNPSVEMLCEGAGIKFEGE